MLHLRSMEGIAHFNGDNFGSIIKLTLIDYREVLNIPPAVDGRITGSITVADNSQFREIIFTQETASINEQYQDTKHGDTWKRELSFFVPKDRPEVVDWLIKYAKVPCVAIITNAHNERKVVGSMQYPLQLSKADLAVKEKVSGLVGRSFTYKNVGTKPAPFYNPPQFLLLNEGGLIFTNNQEPIIL